MNIVSRFIFVIILTILSALYIVPWKQFGVENNFLSKQYVLGLDLQGGVELDYKVDLSAVSADEWQENDPSARANKELIIVEKLKEIIDGRVRELWLSEPTIQTLRYGTDTHIIVQIPTESYNNLSDEERIIQQQKDIQLAKDTIGKVVQLEFKEARTTFSEEDFTERKQIAEMAKIDLETLDFRTLSQKYASQYERVLVKSGTGSLPSEANIENMSEVSEFPFISQVQETQIPISYVNDAITKTSTGFVVTKLQAKMGENDYEYQYVLVDAEPSEWKSAKTADGKILNDKYLISASAGYSQGAIPEVALTFNEEWKKIFAEISTRLVGQQMAIFVGGKLLTAPVVNVPITDGRAVITGERTFKDAQELANSITTGIVPAPIYLSSERVIDAKIGANALEQILVAGFISLALIVVFLVCVYKLGGLLAGIALIIYALILVALIKFFGVVLTLAAIAWVILSIGLAIDANILIFERTHEALKEKVPLNKAINIGFSQSWTAIWDSHITSFMSALILFLFGVSLIRGFGLMLGIGILLSMFTAMWVSRVLILFLSQYVKNPKILLGYNEKNK